MLHKYLHEGQSEPNEWIPIEDFGDITLYDYVLYVGYCFDQEVVVSGILHSNDLTSIMIVPRKFGEAVYIPIQNIIDGKGKLFGCTPSLPSVREVYLKFGDS